MNDLSAKVLALEALVLALVKTHPDTNKLKLALLKNEWIKRHEG